MMIGGKERAKGRGRTEEGRRIKMGGVEVKE